jgi:YbgC/YbaW family acyl-CoA thioester hydrolase
MMREVALDVVVRSTEIDVNAHVNNAKFVEYLEWGREEWYDRNGLGYDRLKAMGATTVTVNVNVNYRKECGLGEVLTIQTRPGRLGRTSFVFDQEIRKADGSVAVEATVTLVTIDPESRRPRVVPNELAAALTA